MEFTSREVSSKVFNNWKKQWIAKPIVPVPPKIPFEQLSEKQKNIVSLVITHIKKPFAEQIRSQIRCLVVGNAGVGKSELIAHLRYAFEQQKQLSPDFGYILASLTGAGSFQIRGSTIHSAFGIPCYSSSNREMEENEEESNGSLLSFPKFKSRLENVKIVVIDEFSLVGQRLLSQIDLNMKIADPANAEKPFAGRSMIMLGDIYQTFAVADIPLFYPSSKTRNPELRHVYSMYKTFDKVFLLEKQFRQDGTGEEQDHFRAFLDRLKRRECTFMDLEYVRSRQKSILPPEELNLFNDALHIFPLRQMVWNHNRTTLHRKYTDTEIISIDNGLHTLEIAIGCTVILQKNLSVRVGLSNGSVGRVRDLVYENSMPGDDTTGIKFIIVEFEGYEGERFVRSDKGKGVPIFRQADSEFDDEKGKYIPCRRFPLELGYAMTGHKAQGKNLSRVAIFLGKYQLFVGLDYVMLSRTRKLVDICILDEHIEPDRLLQKVELSSATTLQKYEEKRLMTVQDDCIKI